MKALSGLPTRTIEADRASGVVQEDSLSCVPVDTTVVDTTVMEKNIAYPTDARLYEKARSKIVALAREAGIELRQTYARKAPRLAAQVGRHAHARQFTGNPYDGHTLAEALEQVEILTDQRPELPVVDRGYRGHGVKTTQVLIPGAKRGMTPKLKKLLRRRSAIEPKIGHMKTDARLAKCPLKGTRRDAIFAVLCGCGHNPRKILNHIRNLLTLILTMIRKTIAEVAAVKAENTQPYPTQIA